MEVREYRAEDLASVCEIQHAAYAPLYEKYHDDGNPYLESEETIRFKYTYPGCRGYVFWEDGCPVGCVRIRLAGEKGKVAALAVLPEKQGRGIAQTALRLIEEMHPQVKRWSLDTIAQEPGNCHLYEKLGYRKTGRVEEVSDLLTIVFYDKNL